VQTDAGHVFGILGQGELSMPIDGRAWSYKNPYLAEPFENTNRTHTMIISILPNSLPFTASSSILIELEVNKYTWNPTYGLDIQDWP